VGGVRLPLGLPIPFGVIGNTTVFGAVVLGSNPGGGAKRRDMFISKARLEKIKTEAWNDGFDTGRKKAVNETRKVFIKLLTKEAALDIIDNIQGLNRAIEILRKGKQ
jgi:hypothetical protein